MAGGGADNGAPGPRPDFRLTYYAAFLKDPDGYEVEVVINAPVAGSQHKRILPLDGAGDGCHIVWNK